MNDIQKINENIYRMTMPYKDIFTTVYAVKTEKGALLFDAASYDEDIENYIVPFLEKLDITKDMLKFVFISHNHKDHAGGLCEFMKKYPETSIISRSPELKENYKDYNVAAPCDEDCFLDVLKVITIPGHTKDSSAVFDMRTKTMISGDCLQLSGIYGSGNWAANISFPKEHIDAVSKLKKMDIEHILTAHDYHPYGYSYMGKDAVEKALDACVAPLEKIKSMICENPDADDEEICRIYNLSDEPTLGVHVVTAVRKEL